MDAPLASLDPITLAAAALVLVAVFLLGLAAGRRHARHTAERARELEDRLALAEDEMSQYRTQVSEHFGQTSQLLRDLTLQYRNVYEHLAEGARTLCPESGSQLPTSLAEAALPASASPDPGRDDGAAATLDEAGLEPDDSQLDLDLESADEWHERAGSDDRELEPMLDEQLDELDEARATGSERRA